MAQKATGRATTKKDKPFSLMEDLLEPIYATAGKGFPASKLVKLGAEHIKKAVQDGLVEERPDKKGSKYHLTSAGEKQYLQHLPLERKLEELGVRQQKLGNALEHLRQEMEDILEFTHFENMPPELVMTLNAMRHNWQDASHSMQAHLSLIQSTVAAAHSSKDYQSNLGVSPALPAVLAPSPVVRTPAPAALAPSPVVLTPAPAALAPAPVVPTPAPVVLAPTPVALAPAPVVLAPAPVTLAPARPEQQPGSKQPEEKELVAALQRAYHSTVAMQQYSKVVELPELYENIKQEFPDLSIPYYKEVLTKLYNRCVIDLHPVNDLSQILSREFIISTSLGELYYIIWR